MFNVLLQQIALCKKYETFDTCFPFILLSLFIFIIF